jgi:hypothetical protein
MDDMPGMSPNRFIVSLALIAIASRNIRHWSTK